MLARSLQRSLPQLPWLLSLVLHAGLLFRFYVPSAAPLVPAGYWVEMAPFGSTLATPRKAKPRQAISHDSESPAEASSPAASAPQKTALGNALHSDGVSGPLGQVDGVQASVRERYLYELEAFINQGKTYPPRARHLGLTGRVDIAFHLSQDGQISDPHIVRPCIHDVLNRAAVELVSSAGKFRPLPQELGLTVLHVTVPIQYELN